MWEQRDFLAQERATREKGAFGGLRSVKTVLIESTIRKDSIFVTKAIVSRVEEAKHVHGATQLIIIQVDAFINLWNKGDPATTGEKAAGVASQNISGAENIGKSVWWVALDTAGNFRNSVSHGYDHILWTYSLKLRITYMEWRRIFDAGAVHVHGGLGIHVGVIR